MKRKLSLLCILLLALATVLTACNNAKPTELVTRWDNDEEYLFNISLADFSKDNKYSFTSYPHGSDVYSKDFRIQNSLALESAVTEEIRPEQVKGTYKVAIHTADGFTELKTEQVIYAQYKKADLEKLDKWSELKTRETTETGIFEADASMTVLKSTFDTYVKFATGTAQKPVESQTSAKTFYVGEKDQNVSQFIVTAKYDFDEKKVTVNRKADENDKGEESVNSLSVSANVNFIDSNQLFLYARSLDKSAEWQDSPRAVVYNASENKHYTATFFLTLKQKAVLSPNGENKFTELNATAITLSLGSNSSAFMMQENLPNLTEKGVDTMANPGDPGKPFAKHTVVRFRVGSLAYELAEYPQGAIEAIEVK